MSKQPTSASLDFCWWATMLCQVHSPFEEGWEWGDIYVTAL